MGCGVKWEQIGQLDKALRKLRIAGLGPGSDVYEQLWRVRGRVFGQIGYKFPREVIQLLRFVGLSPGKIILFFDIEAGYMTVATAAPNAAPVSKYISDDLAITLLKHGLTHEIEEDLMAPDPYIGE